MEITGPYRLDRRQRGGILSPRLLQYRRTCLTKHERATERIVFEQHFARPMLSLAPGDCFTTGQGTHTLHRDIEQNGRMHEFVHQSHLPRLAGTDVFAGEYHVERRLQPHDSRKPLGTAGARQQTELHFG